MNDDLPSVILNCTCCIARFYNMQNISRDSELTLQSTYRKQRGHFVTKLQWSGTLEELIYNELIRSKKAKTKITDFIKTCILLQCIKIVGKKKGSQTQKFLMTNSRTQHMFMCHYEFQVYQPLFFPTTLTDPARLSKILT